MNVVKKSAKTKEEALNLVLKELNASEAEVNYDFLEIKGGLFKGTTYECSGFLKLDIIADVEEYVKTVITSMGATVNLEVSTSENTTTIKIYSPDSALIIGKNGQNLAALSVLAKQLVKNITFNGPRIILDVEDYREKQIKRLERLAKNLAFDVRKTKVDAQMDSMNSYERRIVHNVLTNFKDIKTESVGEEPDRHIIIKYVGE